MRNFIQSSFTYLKQVWWKRENGKIVCLDKDLNGKARGRKKKTA